MLWGLLVLALASGCIEDQLVHCADGVTTCPAGYVCVGDGRCTTSDLRCGDGFLANGEVCDGSALGEATCESEGFYTGTLACTAECGLDVASCAGRCGDGVVDPIEQCDGSTAASCFELGSSFGRATCGGDCQPSVAPCLDLGWSVTYTADAPIVSAVWVGDRYFLRLAGGDVVELDATGERNHWPQLFGSQFGSLDGTGPSDVWLLTNNQLAHFDGTDWTPVTDSGLDVLQLLAVASPSRIVLHGVDNGAPTLAIRDGTSWTRSATNSGVSRLAATDDAVYIASRTGLFIFEDGVFTRPEGGERVLDVATDGATTFAVGDAVYRVRDDKLSAEPGIGPVERIHALGGGRFLAFTNLAEAYEYDGLTWTRLRTPSVVSTTEITEAGLTADGRMTLASGQKVQVSALRLGDQDAKLLWAFPDAVWIQRDEMLFRNGELPDASSASRVLAWGTLDSVEGDVVFVARNNEVMAATIDRCTRFGCTSLTLGAQRLVAMSGSAVDDVWALTDQPTTLYRFDGSAWSEIEVPLPVLFSLDVVAPDDVYFVGQTGTIAHYDGQTFIFSDLGLPATDNFFSVRAFPGGRAFAVGTAGLFELVDGTWTRVLVPVSTLHVIAGDSPDDLYALGSLALYHRDASGWVQVELPDLASVALSLYPTDTALWFDTVTSFSRLAPRPR